MLKQTLNKGISTPIAIGIILILVIIVGGFTWLQYGEMWRETGELPEIELPEKEKVADWKTYMNEAMKFEIKYPNDWKMEEKLLNVNFVKTLKKNSYKLSCEFQISLAPSGLLSSTLELHNKFMKAEDWQKEDIILNGISTIKISYPSFPITSRYFLKRTEETHYLLLHDVNKLTLDKGTVLEEHVFNQECMDTFNQMLSTFRFIEVQTIETKANFVYLTDGEYNGNLGGRLGVDEKCISLPELNCKPETIHAFITVDKDDSIINMAENYELDKNLPIYFFNRTSNKKVKKIANNWSEMISGGDFELSLEGTELVGMNFAWTGGKGTGEHLATCNQWTTDEGDSQTGAGPQGTFGGGDSLFSASGWAGITHSRLCYNKHNLLCICEGNTTQSLIE